MHCLRIWKTQTKCLSCWSERSSVWRATETIWATSSNSFNPTIVIITNILSNYVDIFRVNFETVELFHEFYKSLTIAVKGQLPHSPKFTSALEIMDKIMKLFAEQYTRILKIEWDTIEGIQSLQTQIHMIFVFLDTQNREELSGGYSSFQKQI